LASDGALPLLDHSTAGGQGSHEDADDLVPPALKGAAQLVLLPAAALQEAVVSLGAVGFLLALVPQALVLAFQLADPLVLLLPALFVVRDLMPSPVESLLYQSSKGRRMGQWRSSEGCAHHAEQLLNVTVEPLGLLLKDPDLVVLDLHQVLELTDRCSQSSGFLDQPADFVLRVSREKRVSVGSVVDQAIASRVDASLQRQGGHP
jgi:hypothetical protein